MIIPNSNWRKVSLFNWRFPSKRQIIAIQNTLGFKNEDILTAEATNGKTIRGKGN